ncbi:MAG: hypothetical protein GY866_34935, partial [Proteobacteria bacterium]|nr:hypothetical protein [Pseudomonadota bacterium]
IRKGKTRDFWKLKVPKETRNYVPQLHAVLTIVKDLGRYGFEKPKGSLVLLKLRKGTHSLRYIAEKILLVNYRDFKLLNPGYEIDYTPPGRESTLYLKKDWNVGMICSFGLCAM